MKGVLLLDDHTVHVDVAIEHGTLYDGSGNPGRRLDLGIKGDRIVLPQNGQRLEGDFTIDAGGKIVAPGLIDMHAHSGLMLLHEPRHEAKVAQGVTTELVGVDGNSYAPFPNKNDLAEFVAINAGLDGDPSIDYEWATVPEYLDRFEGTTSVNVAMLVGNSALRIATKNWSPEPANGRETADMGALLRDAMDAGAFGLSTGLDYPPSAYASQEELTSLAQIVASYGGIYHTHVRNWLGDGYLDPHLEAEAICLAGGCHMHLTHLYKRGWSHGSARGLLELVERVQQTGPGATFDTYTSPYGGSRLCFALPRWAFEDGLVGLKRALSLSKGPDHTRLLAGIVPRGFSWDEVWVTNFRTAEYAQFDGCSVSAIAAALDVSCEEAVRRMLSDDGLQLSQVTLGSHTDTRPLFLLHELSMVGSDGLLIGHYPSPRTYGAFATILETYVRREAMLPLAEAVRKMTSFPAATLGLHKRGLLADGYYADVIVFGLDEIESPATRLTPRLLAQGVSHVFVNGVQTWGPGGHTGIFGGRALRRGKES